MNKFLASVAAIICCLGAGCMPVHDHPAETAPLVERNATIDPIFAERRTINPFLAWNVKKGRSGNRYSLAWTADPYRHLYAQFQPVIRLSEIYWAYNYTNKHWSYYPGIESYISTRAWNGGSVGTPDRYANDLENPAFIDFITRASIDKAQTTSSNGIILDWWHDNHAGSNGFSPSVVRAARMNLVNEVRETAGDSFLILGNVNWHKDTVTVSELNGVFLELWKSPYGSRAATLYSRSELFEIEDLLHYYEQRLAYPRLVALNGWRKTTSVSDADRNTPANRRMAKILTAMSVVIPTHGYILYGDNNPDTPAGDHDHLYYDFYRFDVGKPTSGYQRVSRGIGFKEHDRGVVAYNITGRDVNFRTSDGRKFTVPANSGLFCEYAGATEQCLSED